MNIAAASIEKRIISWLMVVILILGGISSFGKLGRLEDPEFTIKDALIFANYPGASAYEVEQEVTDKIELQIQQMAQVDEIKSESFPGQSQITITMKDKYGKEELPQIWDILRKKVSDIQATLPAGAHISMVNDDFGDVYGLYLGISGKGYNYRELKEEAKFLRRELSLVKGVSKIEIQGAQPEQIFIEISTAKLSQLDISITDIQNALQNQNTVASAGSVKVGSSSVRIQTSGIFNSVDDIANIIISKNNGSLVYLKDIAKVYSGFDETPRNKVLVDGQRAITLGISALSGVNVVELGHKIDAKMEHLQKLLPAGMALTDIYSQPKYVESSVSSFLNSLAQAVIIVIVILLIFMGLKSGLLIGSILILTIAGTFIFMSIFNIDLQRISLGALIIALGMLVDNAIVVTEGILVRVQQGEKAKQASIAVVNQTIWPLFGATVVGILAFSGIGLSEDSVGEFCQTLFYVILISLLLSWVLAVTLTPFFCDMVLKPSKQTDENKDPYSHPVFKGYKTALTTAIKHRRLTILSLIIALGASIYGFGFIPQSFFPNSTTPMFYVHYWKPQGTDIRSTEKDIVEISKYVKSLENVKRVTSLIGQGASRFMLVYNPEKPNSSYGQLIIQTEEEKDIPKVLKETMNFINSNYQDQEARPERIRLGPGGGQKIEARIVGDDPKVLRELADKVEDIYYNSGKATAIRNNWRQPTKIIQPRLLETQIRNAGLTRSQVNSAIAMAFGGTTVGSFRDGDEFLPIIMRTPSAERNSIESLDSLQVYSPIAKSYIPLSQLVDSVEPKWEDNIVRRKDRRRTITISADPIGNLNAMALFGELRPQVEALDLPDGYYLEWGGEYEDSGDAQKSLFSVLPNSLLLMIITVILLFNAVRQPLIIWLCVPLAIIGVTAGLLLFNGSFGFMALLGFLSLSGMLIKNAVVLIDQIDLEIAEGKEHYKAVVESSISRVRPVSMGAVTTVLGMIPLLSDAFFVDMAITIMAGLTFATVLTLFVVPVLYTIFFRIKYRKEI